MDALEALIERRLATGPKSRLDIWAYRGMCEDTRRATGPEIQAALDAAIAAGRIRELHEADTPRVFRRYVLMEEKPPA